MVVFFISIILFLLFFDSFFFLIFCLPTFCPGYDMCGFSDEQIFIEEREVADSPCLHLSCFACMYVFGEGGWF